MDSFPFFYEATIPRYVVVSKDINRPLLDYYFMFLSLFFSLNAINMRNINIRSYVTKGH